MNRWFFNAARKVSGVLFILSAAFIYMTFSTIGENVMSVKTANVINNILIGISTGFIGIIVTVLFVQYTFDKQDEAVKRKDEIMTIKRYDKYMETLIRRYSRFYISVTTRRCNWGKVDFEHPFEHIFSFSDMADMYRPSMYLSEGFLEPSIELFYRAEEDLRNYMLRMLENIDFKYNDPLEKILLEFVTKSVDLDMRGNILGALKTKFGNEKATDCISREIADEKYDWLGKFQRKELNGNTMLPYVTFFYNIQNQMRLLQKYLNYVKQLDSE